jgi:hypothetical protein
MGQDFSEIFTSLPPYSVNYFCFMRKLFFCLAVTAIFVAASSIAQAQDDGAKEFAEYSAGVAISPFGPSLNLTYNIDAKNSISVGFGGAPEGDVPDGLLPDFDPLLLSEVSVAGSSSWLGVFWRHRPFANQAIGFNLGMASGQIENNVTADGFHAGETVSFSVNYTENPVMYFGVSYGSKPVKGFQVGLDLGALSTGGAQILYTGEAEELVAHGDDIADQIAEINDKLAWTMLPNLQLSVSYGF